MRVVFFQGHPEYDTVSLLKEYKREAMRYHSGGGDDYPPLPEHYFSVELCDLLNDYACKVRLARREAQPFPAFPEADLLPHIDNTWRDTAKAVFNNWLGLIYQVTGHERSQPFMRHLAPMRPVWCAEIRGQASGIFIKST